MPRYDFITDDGAVFTREMTVQEFMDLPMEGNRIVLDGQLVKRHIDSGGAVSGADHKWFKPGIDHTLPKWCKGFQHDAKGHPIVESMRQLNDYRKRMEMEWV